MLLLRFRWWIISLWNLHGQNIDINAQGQIQVFEYGRREDR